MTKKILISIMLFIYLSLNSIQLEIEKKELYFNLGSGISYNFNFSQNIVTNSDHAFFDVPLAFEFDFRPRREVAISTGVIFYYNYHLYELNGFTVENNNLLIDIPLDIKYFPFASRESSHYYFYIGAGLFFRAWPINYYSMKSASISYSGNGYNPDNNYIQPGDSYMPVNVGTKLFLGNVLKFNKTVGAGLEISAKYLFIPFINGYLSKSQYNSSNNITYLNFWASMGIKLYIHFDLTSETTSHKK